MPRTACLSILLVEDDRDLLAAMARELQRNGHRCVPVASGERALAEWQHGTFDLVVTDLRMDGLDGAELAATVCRSELVPVVVITGFRADYEDKLRCFSHVEVLEKPFPLRKLVELVSSVVAPARVESDNGAHAEQQAAQRAP